MIHKFRGVKGRLIPALASAKVRWVPNHSGSAVEPWARCGLNNLPKKDIAFPTSVTPLPSGAGGLGMRCHGP